jgi:hypothetical protein
MEETMLTVLIQQIVSQNSQVKQIEELTKRLNDTENTYLSMIRALFHNSYDIAESLHSAQDDALEAITDLPDGNIKRADMIKIWTDQRDKMAFIIDSVDMLCEKLNKLQKDHDKRIMGDKFNRILPYF